MFTLQDVVLMRALRDMNLPKFVFEDVPLFFGLISDLFPLLDCPRVCYPSLNDAVEHILQESKYVIMPNQVSDLTFILILSDTQVRLLHFSNKYLVPAYELLDVVMPYSLWFQVDKVVQLYETMMTRHTTMIVGPTGGGKSVVISTLCQAQTKSVSIYITFICATLIKKKKKCFNLYYISSLDWDYIQRCIH